MKKVIWMFSGQGSQFFQMGKELFASEPSFRRVMEEGDRIVQRLTHRSLIEEIYRPRDNRFEPFSDILSSHPAIILIECALAQLLVERGLRPDFLLGYSVGEVSSLVTAGSMSLEEALVTLVKSAAVLEYAAPRGGMIAILEAPSLMQARPELFLQAQLAGSNSPKSFIIAVREAHKAETLDGLKQAGISALELPVAYPFHSSWMDEVATPLRAVLAQTEIRPPCYPLLSAGKGGTPLSEWGADHLYNAVRTPVDFVKTIQDLERNGPAIYLDLGPSGSMATAVKYSLPEGSSSEFFPVLTPYGQDNKNFARLLERLR